jgi:predicted nucleic acid-binding protein
MPEDAYLLDTSIASALWDELHVKHGLFRRRWERLPPDRVFVSVVSLAEVDYGLRVAPKIDHERQRHVREAMSSFVVLPLDRHVAESYAELRARLFTEYSPRGARGRLSAKVVPDLWERTPDKLLGVQENDLWIASQAMERNYILATTDRMVHIVEVAGSGMRFDYWQ